MSTFPRRFFRFPAGFLLKNVKSHHLPHQLFDSVNNLFIFEVDKNLTMKPLKIKYTTNELDHKLSGIMDKHLKIKFENGATEEDLEKEFAILYWRKLTQLKFRHFPRTMQKIKSGARAFEVKSGLSKFIKQ